MIDRISLVASLVFTFLFSSGCSYLSVHSEQYVYLPVVVPIELPSSLLHPYIQLPLPSVSRVDSMICFEDDSDFLSLISDYRGLLVRVRLWESFYQESFEIPD